jgi:UDP-N-acetylmuramoylalanine--D-glutamate ligase
MKKIVILGAGESGVGAALLAKKIGLDVFVSDKSVIKDNFRAELDAANIAYESEHHDINRIFAADKIVKSPGIPDQMNLIKVLKGQGVPVISEIEFAYENLSFFGKKKPFIIGITGSNGKTTTTGLTYHLLKTAKADVAVGGNIGKSFARLLVEEKIHDYYVLELSSFQLDGIYTFRPNVSMILNITPDHLDRYDYKFENYVASKFRIMMNQGEGDTLIYNGNDPESDKKFKHYRGDINTIPVWMNNWEAGKKIEFHEVLATPNFGKRKIETVEIDEEYTVTNPHLQGPHNYFNALCAVHAFRLTRANKALIQKGLDSFTNAPHRLEFVANINGTDYYNDSKATNVDSVFWALSAMSKSTILILGGQDKGNDYRQIEALVRQKVTAIVAMGVDNAPILEFFSPIVKHIEEASSVAEAVQIAEKYSEGEDVVLLSPACASFDLFKNYEDRGTQFKDAVLKILSERFK